MMLNDAQHLSPAVMSKFPVSRHHFSRYEVDSGDLRVTRFRKHADSPAHRTAESMTGDKKLSVDDIDGFAPSSSEWKSVISHTKPDKMSTDVDDVGNRKKVHMMRWCLAEAQREKQREAVKDALCLSLSQDQRGRRFLVRFRSVDSQLAVTDGTCQLVKVQTSPEVPGAQGIRQMTLKALQRFCTPGVPPTYGGLLKGAKDEKECDYELLQAAMAKVECMAADAAGDEQLAMRDLARIRGPEIVQLQDVMGQAFENLKARELKMDINQCDFFCNVDHDITVVTGCLSGPGKRPRTRGATHAEPAMGS